LSGFKGKIRQPMIPYIGPRHDVDLADYLGQTVYIHPLLVVRDEEQIRTYFDPAKLNDLAQTLEGDGQEIVGNIYPLANYGQALGKVLDCERRWRACCLKSLPLLAFVTLEVSDPIEKIRVQLRSNHHNEEHVILDVFRAVVKLHGAGKTQAEIASDLGCQPNRVGKILKLAKLVPRVLAMLDARQLEKDRLVFATAVEITRLPPIRQERFALFALQTRIGTEAAKREINRLLSAEGVVGSGNEAEQRPRAPHISEIYEQFTGFIRTIGTKAGLLKEQPNSVLCKALQRMDHKEIETMFGIIDSSIVELQDLKERIRKCIPKT
jgi:ParB-like chromosome segregation protein Spo0J